LLAQLAHTFIHNSIPTFSNYFSKANYLAAQQGPQKYQAIEAINFNVALSIKVWNDIWLDV